MKYSETIAWLFSQLPMYQRVGAIAFKKDLNNTIALTNYLGNPERNFKSIHVAGTNGKGSVSHMLASVLQDAGYQVGLYTSPHLLDFRERIRINGKPISQREVINFVKENKPFFENHSLSFFEMTVGLAFQSFSNHKVDIAIIEVGLGGRLDSTNVITPEVSVITNIGKDHTQFLGNTLAEIAVEKAGIIKSNIPVVIGETKEETKPVFEKIALEKLSPIVFAENIPVKKYSLDLLGSYQEKNYKTAVVAINTLTQYSNFTIAESNIENGLKCVAKNTGLQGRWQVLGKFPKVICDTAHNAEGLQYVLKQLQEEWYIKLHIVLGVVADKDLEAILPMFPKKAIYYFCKPDIPRGLDASVLMQKAMPFGLKGNFYPSVQDGYSAALKAAKIPDVIFIGGSTFVVAEII
ncbi:MAG: tetrahydrofolate synthase [Flavobacteriaceae bacterium CG02_land_8_20_14_3_00_34_13]|nr:MAG: tetrahydrofolate synthase [Flavobacteriaceae bacterium CG02_land_8_20_14_3_00_34_13]PIZ06981.1 MAG: tetrahydrofolate synthase [Flavobacteriaceae bacterium CG_4_10_14_0_8_um_filter_34_31]PJC08554.1 MAG: tetrahydrofolate synthase [Flavobacteriaceae bacterium CG_4_9_14_0_8_um_filter_34_30]